MSSQASETVTICATEHSGAELEQFAAEHLLDDATAAHTAELFKALADPTRLRMIGLLARAEVCVGDLHAMMGMTQPAISHHLRILRSLRLVKARKVGRHVYYTLDDEHVNAIFQKGLDHVRHD